MDKKALSPLLTTVFLISVAVVGFLAFQNWYISFNSAQLTQAEVDSKDKLEIVGLDNGQLIINTKDSFQDSINISIDDTDCGSFPVTSQRQVIDLSSCINGPPAISGRSDVIVQGKSGISSAIFLIE